MNRAMTPLIVLSLSLFSLLIVLERCHTYHEPLERDIATYAVIGHEMDRGRALYTDLWDHKPPAIDLTFWLAEKITGYGEQEIYFLGVLAAVVTLWGIYAAGARVSREAGLWAAFFWALVNADLLLQGNQPNAEVFINAFWVWGFFFLCSGTLDQRKVFWGGLFFSLAGFYKPQALLPGLLILIAHFVLDEKKESFVEKVQKAILFFASFVALWGVCFLWFWAKGSWADFWSALFTYNEYYVGDTFSNLKEGVTLGRFFPDFLLFFIPLLVFILFGLYRSYRAHSALWAQYFGFCVGVFFTIALPGRFYNHYYQLWLPIWVIGAGWAGILWGAKLKEKIGRYWRVPLTLTALLLVLYETPNYFLDANEWSVKKYGTRFVDASKLMDELKPLLTPEETFFVLSDNTTFYFAARKSPPSGVLYATPAFFGPLNKALQQRMLTDLEREKPPLLILGNGVLGAYYAPFLDEYRIWNFDPRYPNYVFMVRKGSGLEKRILKAHSKKG